MKAPDAGSDATRQSQGALSGTGAEEALRESEERFRTLCENATAGIYRTTPSGRIMLANPALVRMLGYLSFEELALRDLEAPGSFEPGCSRDEFRRRVEENGEVRGLEAEWIRRDGSVLHVRESATAVRDSSGSVLFYDGVVEDITDYKRVQEDLNRRAQQLEGRVRELNCLYEMSRLVEASGRSLEDILQGVVRIIPAAWQHPEITCARVTVEGRQFVTDGFADVPWKLVSNVMVHAEPVGTLEVCYREERPDADEGPFLKEERVLLEAIAEQLGRAIERVRVEELLRAERSRFQRYLDVAGTMLVVIDPEERVVHVNRRGCEVLGYPKEEVVGRNWFDSFVPMHARDRVREVFRTVVAGDTEGVEHCENPVLTPRGKERIIQWHNTLLTHEDGRVIGTLSSGEDVTDRKRAERELKEREQKYRLISENVPVVVYSALPDEHSTNVFVSGKAVELTGYTADEFLADPTLWSRIVHPDDLGAAWAAVGASRNAKTPLDVEYRVVTKEGLIKWVRDKATPLLDDTGRIVTINGFMEDITERKRAEAARVESELRFRTLTDNLNVGVYRNTVGPKGRFIEANPAIVRMFGYDGRDEFLSVSVADLYQDPADRARFSGEMLRDGSVQAQELRLRRRDGSSFIGSVSAVAVRDRDGTVLYYDGIIEDVTSLKLAEEALLTQKAYMDQLFESAQEAIVMTDNAGVIIRANTEFLQLFGYTGEEVVGCQVDDLVAVGSLQEEASSVTRRVAAGERIALETVRRRKDGVPIEVSVLGAPIVVGGEQVAVYAIYRDITERKRTERAFRDVARKIEELHGVVRRMEVCETSDEVHALTLEAAERVLGLSTCRVCLPEGDALVTKVVSVGFSQALGSVGDPCDGTAERTYRAGKTQIIGRVRGGHGEGSPGGGFRSCLSVPIGEVAVFEAFSTEPDFFSEDDARLVELLVGHAAEELNRIRLQDELKRQAIQDPLTGVFNRHYLERALELEVKRCERYAHPLAFLMIDVDGFKEINDRHGHQTGDKVLRVVASWLLDELRETDLVVRYGGDEFLVILPETGENAEIVRRRVLESVARRGGRNEDLGFPVSLSVGCAHWRPTGEETVQEVLSRADERMYEHKRAKATDAP